MRVHPNTVQPKRRMKIRKKRPTLVDAHEFFRSGYSVGGDDYVTPGERATEAQHIEEELRQIAATAIPRTRNLEYMILKCHLITEFALTQYIRFHAVPVVGLKEIRFGYAQKLEVAYLMGFGVANTSLIPSLELLNRVRNQVAHTFHLDVAVVNELLRINSDDYDDFQTPTLSQQLQGLRQITRFVCGMTAGVIRASASLGQ